MSAPEGYCWLCGEFGILTKEHIPPEKAYNNCPRLLMKIDERGRENGDLNWVPGTSFTKGFWVRSLCAICNNKYGDRYGASYVDLVQRVAERLADTQRSHTISILHVRNPLLILKQIMLQFVTANGDKFVTANDWVAPFIMEKWNNVIPRNVAIYLFAHDTFASRKSGVTVHRDLIAGRTNYVAEFTSWPLGTVISFDGELQNDRIVPVHHWTKYTYGLRNQSADLHLPVNPVVSEYPLDFRTASEIYSGRTNEAEGKSMSEEDAKQMIDKVKVISGESDDWIFTGHPNTVKRLVG